jgi:hypothetical protein
MSSKNGHRQAHARSGGGVFIRIIKKNLKVLRKLPIIIDGRCNPAVKIWPD